MSKEREGATRGLKNKGRKKKEAEQTPFGDSHLFVIGINEYLHCPPLYNAVKDAQDILATLTNDYQFDPDRTVTLFDSDATQENIITELRELITRVKERDNVLIYFSGHGEYDVIIDQGHWIPVDGKLNNIGSFISFDLVKKILKAIKSHHTFVIADSCYSGAMFTERSAGDVKQHLESLPSRWLLTAGRNEVVADGKPGDNSPFADAILYRLRNNDQPRLSVSEFCNYIITDVRNNANQLPRGSSLHGVGDRGGEFMFRKKEFKDTFFEDNKEVVQVDTGVNRTVSTNTNSTPAPVEVAAPAINSIDALKKAMKTCIGLDKFEETFQLFDEYIDDSSALADTLIMQKGRYNRLERENTSGVLSRANYNQETAKIRKALLSMVEEVSPRVLQSGKLSGTSMASNGGFSAQLSDQERSGLEMQASLLQEKINFYRSQLPITADVAQKFTLTKQIEGAEKELAAVKEKLKI